MRRNLFLAGFCLSACGAPIVQAPALGSDAGRSGVVEPPPSRFTGPVPEVLGGNRPTNVIFPEGYDRSESWPLIIVLHGYSAGGIWQDRYLGVSARGSQFGYITLAPNGTRNGQGNRFWNATEACCDFGDSRVDDLGYLTGLIDEAIEKLNVDPMRVYLVGHSNGGFMANRVACDAASKVTAVMNIAGSSFMDSERCRADESVGYLHVHGDLDTVIAYGGGRLATGASYPGAEEIVRRWRLRNTCAANASERRLDFDDGVLGDETTASTWSGCDGGMDVQLWSLRGSSHIPGFNGAFQDELAAQLLSYMRR